MNYYIKIKFTQYISSNNSHEALNKNIVTGLLVKAIFLKIRKRNSRTFFGWL